MLATVSALAELRALIAAGRLTPAEYSRLRERASGAEVAELANLARFEGGLAGIGDNGAAEDLEEDEDVLRHVLPRMLTRAERRRPVASPVIRAALEAARALPRGAPWPVQRAILDRVEAELRQTDEDERGRVLILTYEALGLPRE